MDARKGSSLAVVVTMLLVLALVSLVPSYAQTADMTDVIEDCCGRGISFAIMDRNCSDMSRLLDMPFSQQDACVAVFMSCCTHQKASADCDDGILHRLDLERGDCAAYPTDSCNPFNQGKECCDCCGLGIEAYSLGIPCNHMSIDTPCDHAFETCCMRTRQQNDVNECTRSGRVLCSQRCINTIGSFKCGCREGWRLEADGYSCTFVTTESMYDPCLDSPCSQGCRSIGSSYICLCSTGYELASDDATCEDIDECTEYLYPCDVGEDCYNQPGTFVCRESSGGISCPRGLRYSRASRSCEDIDECDERSDNCNQRTETCYNTFKGFRCIQRQRQATQTEQCPLGFTQRRGRCVDIDECAGGSECGIGQRCDNYPGTFQCSDAYECGSGYQLNYDTQNCEDINECAQNGGDCPIGTRCENLEGDYRCNRILSCGTGYTLDAETQQCEDVNECTERQARCHRNQRCVNLVGSSICENCEQGFKVDDNNECTIDINECATRTHTCTRNQRCFNTVGSYRCNCISGFELDEIRNDCFDIDECNPPDGDSPCLPHQFCYNMPGEYDCQNMCSYGARYTRGTCVDIDECAEGTHQCNDMQECINQEGGHICRCPRGYRLTRSNRGCEDIDECVALPNSCRGSCENTEGSFRCHCPEGYTLNENGFSCNDINECMSRLDDCGPNQECFNTLGSFKCRSMECPQYYERRLAGNQRECVKIFDLCPVGDKECRNNVTTQYSYTAIAIHSIPYLSSPMRLMTMDIGKSTDSQVILRLARGNERNYFHVQKRIVTNVHVRASLMLIQPVNGPYSTDLHLQVKTIRRNRLIQQTVVVIHVDIGANLW